MTRLISHRPMVLLLLLGVAGCGSSKVDFSQTVELGPTDTPKIFTIEGPKAEQKITVSFQSEGEKGPEGARVFVILEKDMDEEAQNSLENNDGPRKKLYGSGGKDDKGKSILKSSDTWTGTIPAKEKFLIIVGTTNKKIKVTISAKSE